MPGSLPAAGLFGLATLGVLGGMLAVASVASVAGAGDAPAPDYQLRVPAQASLQRGAIGAISLTIAAAPGHTVSRDAPVTVELSVMPSKGLTLRRTRYDRKHAADARAADPRFDLRVLGDVKGRYRLEIRARFWICASRTCRPIDDKRQVEIDVEAAPAPVPAPDAGA